MNQFRLNQENINEIKEVANYVSLYAAGMVKEASPATKAFAKMTFGAAQEIYKLHEEKGEVDEEAIDVYKYSYQKFAEHIGFGAYEGTLPKTERDLKEEKKAEELKFSPGIKITDPRKNQIWRQEQLKNGDFKHIDEATEKPKSIDEEVINNLKAQFKTSKCFKGVNTETIKQKLGVKISNKKLNQLITKTFKNVTTRGNSNNKNYYLETI